MPTSRPLPVLRPDRLRRIPRSFAWLDHRLRSGLLAALTPEEIALYLFLALASDSQGLSCWRLDRIEGLEERVRLYVDAVTQVLDANRGSWGQGAFYTGGYEVTFDPVQHGGQNFLQIAKVSFEVDVSE